MPWEIGSTILGFGIAIFSLVAPMIGLTLPRWLLSVLLVLSIILITIWPVNLLMTWLQGHIKTDRGFVIFVVVGAIVGATFFGFLWRVNNASPPKLAEETKLGQVHEYLGKDAGRRDVQLAHPLMAGPLSSTSTSEIDLYRATVNDIPPMTPFFVVGHFTKTTSDGVSLGLKLNNILIGPTHITTEQKTGTVTWFIGTQRMSLRWKSRNQSYQTDLSDERPVAPIRDITFHGRVDSGTLTIDEAWIYTLPIDDYSEPQIPSLQTEVVTYGLYAERPALTKEGQLFRATDKQILYEYRNGTWIEMRPVVPLPDRKAFNAIPPKWQPSLVGRATLSLKGALYEIAESENVSSYTDAGAGHYILNWAQPFKGNNYGVWISASSGIVEYKLQSGSVEITIKAQDGSTHDPQSISILAMQ